MSEPRDKQPADLAALWRRFRALDSAGRDQAADVALDLAAYADGRLSETAAEAIETWLTVHPEALGDLVAARGTGDVAAPQHVVDRAAALVTGDASDGRVVPFRRPAIAYAWRAHIARVAVAACLVLTGLAGFTLGSGAYDNLFSSTSASGDTADQPTSFFSTEDTAI